MASRETIVEAFANNLALAGCRRAFGLAGEDHVELLAALDRAGIRYIRAYNETSAVLMAAADAQATGRFGVAVVSMSAGMSNAVNGLTHALMEQVPMLVVSGRQPAADRPFVVRQGFDVESLARPVTKWQVHMATGIDVGRLLAKALFIATEAPPGPVYVELPADVGRSVPADDPRWQTRIRQQAEGWTHALPRRLEHDELVRLDSALRAATYPLLVAGGRTRLDGGAVAALAEARRIPVLVTPNQKGLVTPGNPFDAGVFLNGTPERRLLDRADLVLAVDLQGFDIYGRQLPPDLDIVLVSPAPITNTFLNFSLEFVGDPDDALRNLAHGADTGSSQWTKEDVAEYRSWLRTSLRDLDRIPGSLTTTDAVATLADALPDDVTLVADAGFSKPLMLHMWEPHRPGAFYASNAFGTMGHALPTAIALKLAEPSRPTVAMMGDGSLLMRAGELQAAADAGVDPVVVAICDRSFTQIAVKQERRGLPALGVDLPELSGKALGQAFGCHGADADCAEALTEELGNALHADGPSVIAAHTKNTNANAVFGFLRG